MAQSIMKWDGFNLLYPQNLTKTTAGYGDMKPSDVRGNMVVFSDSTIPNRGVKSTTDQQKDARVLWNNLDTNGGGNQKNTGAAQLRLWFYSSSGFKTIPTGYHYRFVRMYDISAEWIGCLGYEGKDLVFRTGKNFGNTKKVVWKNALSDSGWVNKWHRIEMSCNNTKNISSVRIDSRTWVDIPWGTSPLWGRVGGKVMVPLYSVSVGATEQDSPNNVAFRNIELLDSHDHTDFTQDWVPPVAPKFALPSTYNANTTTEAITVKPSSATVGSAPIKSAKWYSTFTRPDAAFTNRSLIKTELTANLQDPANFSVVRGPYTDEGTEKVELEIEDQNNYKVVKYSSIMVGPGADTGPVISASNKSILTNSGTTVNIVTSSAGNNGAFYPEYVAEADPTATIVAVPGESAGGTWPSIPAQSATFEPTAEPVTSNVYSFAPSDSNPTQTPCNITYNNTGTSPWNVLVFSFDPITVAGDYSYDVEIKNSKGVYATLTFGITVNQPDVVEFTPVEPAPPNELGELPNYLEGSVIKTVVDVTSGNRGTLSLAGSTAVGATLSNVVITNTGTSSNGAAQITADAFVTNQEVDEERYISFQVKDALGDTSNQSPMYFKGDEVTPPQVFLTPDFLVNSQITPEFTIEADVIQGTRDLNWNTYYWQITKAPGGYTGTVAMDEFTLTFGGYGVSGNYEFTYSISDTAGIETTATCHVYISASPEVAPDAPRDILDWMSNTQLEQEAYKALSGISLVGNNKQDIEWYRRQVLSMTIPNIGTMSYEEVERQWYKAIINGDLERNLTLYGELDGGTPDSMLMPDEDTPVPDDEIHDSDEPELPPINPPKEPEEPPVPATINFEQVVRLQHNVRRVLQSFAYDVANNVWFAAQVNPDSTFDTLIYKFNSAGEYLGSMNMIGGGHGSSITHQKVGSTDYIWTSYAASGVDEVRSIARAKYTNGSSVTIKTVEKMPNMYGTAYQTVNLYGSYITVRTILGNKETYRLYNYSDYVAGKNKPLKVIDYDYKKANLPAYQGHAADEKYLYVHRGGNYFTASDSKTLWDKPYLMVYEWSTKKVRIISTFEPGYDIASGKTEAEGVQRYDVGGVKYIYIGKATGKTGARKYNILRFTRNEMEAWFREND